MGWDLTLCPRAGQDLVRASGLSQLLGEADSKHSWIFNSKPAWLYLIAVTQTADLSSVVRDITTWVHKWFLTN